MVVLVEAADHDPPPLSLSLSLSPSLQLPFYESHFDEFALTQASILSAFFLFVSILILVCNT